MECRATVSKKLGGSFNGTSIYDGVFSGSAPFRSSSFSSSTSSRPEDYSEIFGGPRDSRRSSIPVLDVPALHERKVSVDVRSSKLEYSNIFGGGSDGGAKSYEDVVVDPRKMRNLTRKEPPRAHSHSSSEVSFSGSEDYQVLQNASHPSLGKVKKQFNVSYNKSVGGGKDGINGTTHVAQLHDVPGYARLVDENNPSRPVKGDKPVINDAPSEYVASNREVKTKNVERSKSSQSMGSPVKEYSTNVLRSRDRTHSSLFEGYEFGLREETSEMQGSTVSSPNVSRTKVNSRVSECGVSIGSPNYFEDEVDANSVAAASADAVRKAIEKAQARIKIAKELMEKRKEGFQSNAESKSLQEQRREQKRLRKLREKESREQRLKESGQLDSAKMDHEITDFRQRLQFSDDKEKLTMRPAKLSIEDAVGNSTTFAAVGVIPLPEVHNKIECEMSIYKGAQECGSNLNNLESTRQLHYLERNQLDVEVKGRQCDNAEELMEEFHVSLSEGNLDEPRMVDNTARVKDCGREETVEKQIESRGVEGDIESRVISDNENCGFMKIDGKQENEERGVSSERQYGLEKNERQSEGCEGGVSIGSRNFEETVREEVNCQEESEEKQIESREAEGDIKSSIVSDNENSECEKTDGKQENEERDERQSEGHEREGSVGSRSIHNSEETTTYEVINEKEENRERRGEARERECGPESEGTIDKQDTREYSGFSFGADAKQWLDHMKGILNVRINSFLDAKENRRVQESVEVEDNCRIETEGSEEILEETRGMEATRELDSAQDSIVDENVRIDADVEREAKGEDATGESEVDGSEKLKGTTEVVGDEENKESVDNIEEKENEFVVEITDFSVEEIEVLVSDSTNLNEAEASNLSVEEEDASSSNLEEMCGSETLDLTGPEASVEADGEKQVQDAMEDVGFSENNVRLGFTCIKFGFLQNDHQYAKEPEEIYGIGKHAEELDSLEDESIGDDKGAEILSNDEEGAEDIISQEEVEAKVSDDDGRTDELNVEENHIDVVNERNEERREVNDGATTSQATEMEEENLAKTKMANENEAKDCRETEVEPERDMLRNESKDRERERDREKETEREREKERLAVERAIREARERAFAEARERAERAAVEKASAEARRRVMAQAREKLGKASSETSNKPAEKTSAEARLRAERAAVERATAEARERALEKAISEKLSGAAGKDNKARQRSSYDAQHKSSASANNHRNSNSSDSGVPRSTERTNGADSELAQRSKATLERHQRTAERAAKALAEKNMRDLLAQREQAERNRLAEALDADIKRWSSGKQGNLRALLSTLQYILGPDSGWQPVTLTEIITAAAVKKSYRKATLCVHPDKLQQRGASLQQKYICEKVFDLLKEAWNRFNAEEK